MGSGLGYGGGGFAPHTLRGFAGAGNGQRGAMMHEYPSPVNGTADAGLKSTGSGGGGGGEVGGTPGNAGNGGLGIMLLAYPA